ncbi:hypothetical protein [Novosphingobium sp. MD-1]|uniref:hypothetical protein n=1 Tax=Novosphingobium sp. MD-1 TaxID=1630648 RepID=UPI000F7DA752|nr:hypothetical protein [Novosphingobium sp. MD-1]
MKTAIISSVLAVGTCFVPTTMIDPMARAMVPAIALMATGIFPCMTLTIGAMKAEGRTPALIEELYLQLRGLLKVLVVTFALAVAEIITLTASVALASPGAPRGIEVEPGTFYVTPVQAAAMIAAFILGILSGRIIVLGRAFFEVLEINKKQSLLVARAKVRTERDAAIENSRRARFSPDDATPKRLRTANGSD